MAMLKTLFLPQIRQESPTNMMFNRIRKAVWRQAIQMTSVPTFIRPKPANYWQAMWRDRTDENMFDAYAKPSPLRDWLASEILRLKPRSVLELGCNAAANLEAIWRQDPSVTLLGVELNPLVAEYARKRLAAIGCPATIVVGSMDAASELLRQNNIPSPDVVFTSAVAMHVEDSLFARTKDQILKMAPKAALHLEYNAWTPSDMTNGRNWRSSFLSDRWIRDYVTEYEGLPDVREIFCLRIPPAINRAEAIGRVAINDVSALVVARFE